MCRLWGWPLSLMAARTNQSRAMGKQPRCSARVVGGQCAGRGVASIGVSDPSWTPCIFTPINQLSLIERTASQEEIERATSQKEIKHPHSNCHAREMRRRQSVLPVHLPPAEPKRAVGRRREEARNVCVLQNVATRSINPSRDANATRNATPNTNWRAQLRVREARDEVG